MLAQVTATILFNLRNYEWGDLAVDQASRRDLHYMLQVLAVGVWRALLHSESIPR